MCSKCNLIPGDFAVIVNDMVEANGLVEVTGCTHESGGNLIRVQLLNGKDYHGYAFATYPSKIIKCVPK